MRMMIRFCSCCNCSLPDWISCANCCATWAAVRAICCCVACSSCANTWAVWVLRRGSSCWVCWRTSSSSVGSGRPGEKWSNTGLVPMGISIAGTSRCTPKACSSDSAICLNLVASISAKESSSTKKHISSDIRSAKVMTQAGMERFSSSGSSMATAQSSALRCLGGR